MYSVHLEKGWTVQVCCPSIDLANVGDLLAYRQTLVPVFSTQTLLSGFSLWYVSEFKNNMRKALAHLISCQAYDSCSFAARTSSSNTRACL